jgi:hypothetical protein
VPVHASRDSRQFGFYVGKFAKNDGFNLDKARETPRTHCSNATTTTTNTLSLDDLDGWRRGLQLSSEELK